MLSASLYRAWGVVAFREAGGGAAGSAVDFQRAARFQTLQCHAFCSFQFGNNFMTMLYISNEKNLSGTNFCSRQLPRQQLVAENLGEKAEVDKVDLIRFLL